SLPRVPPTRPIYSGGGNTPSRVLGFPIRTPSDLSSVGSSPRTIAASHVLHRSLVPRHPPCALHNLTTKMLASTLQFSNTTPRNNTNVLPQDPTVCLQANPHTQHPAPSTPTTQPGSTNHRASRVRASHQRCHNGANTPGGRSSACSPGNTPPTHNKRQHQCDVT